MAPRKETVSFDDIIQAGRQQREKQKLADDILGQGRREKQILADQILGQGRRASTQTEVTRNAATRGSFASRVGVAKSSQRSASNTPKAKADVEANRGHDLLDPRAPRVTRPPRENPMARQAKNDLLYETAVTQTPRNGTTRNGFNEEISIRGTAGPYTVIGSNFAPGTTAADIESAMIPSGGEMQSCRIMTSTPTVIAEMVFSEKTNAESVISTFNNKKADGRILHVYMKQGASDLGNNVSPARKPPTEPKETRLDESRNVPTASYDIEREQSDRRRRADPELQDGRYGFEAKEDQMDVDVEVLGSEPSRPDVPRTDDTRSVRRDDRDRDRRDNRREVRYDAPRDGGRGRSYFDRDRDGGRARSDYRLHSDDMYPRPRGRGFR